MTQWKSVVGYKGVYEVSDAGHVRSLSRRVPFLSKRGNWHERVTVLKPLVAQKINSGYLVVHLSRDDKCVARTIHSLVAAAFIGPRPTGYDVAHNNGQRLDNRAANLRYTTRAGNHADKRRHGTHACGTRIAQSKLTERAVRSIRAARGRRSVTTLSAKYGVARASIYRVWKRTSWGHVL
jgi:hypothetical protein